MGRARRRRAGCRTRRRRPRRATTERRLTRFSAVPKLPAGSSAPAGSVHCKDISNIIPVTRRIALAGVLTAASLLGLAAGSTAPPDVTVWMVYRAYQPSQLTVLAGQTVIWRNSGLGPHT